jgi:transcriptional regulator with XRE-family HTH domain
LARLEGSKSAYIPVNRKAIVDRRKHLHLTQVQLAERCGLSDSTISAIETGRAARINDTTAEALERGLQADRARFTYPLAPDLVAIQGSGTKAGSNGALPHGTSDTEILRELFRSFVKLCAQAKVALDWQDGGADAGTHRRDNQGPSRRRTIIRSACDPDQGGGPPWAATRLTAPIRQQRAQPPSSASTRARQSSRHHAGAADAVRC